MGKTTINAALALYGGTWKAALPLLKFNHRLQEGWDQKNLSEGLPAPAHLWIQAASGGESYLTWEILKHLKLDFDQPLRVLVTTNTRQGYETLCRAADDINESRSGIAIQPWYFPFDAPGIMRRIVSHVRPTAALILETEIWPGFLKACKEFGVRTLLANGRMTTKSLGGYMTWPELFRSIGPERIMAVSEADGCRFGTLFGHERIQLMPNIKFDRMATAGPLARKGNPLKELIPDKGNFIVMGSVRKEESTQVKKIAAALIRHRPTSIIGIFPRHMHHVSLWKTALDTTGSTWSLRSEMNGQASPGTVIIWDTFGELVPAYGLAKAAFIGGSLVPLGGQNFLEPLTCGVTPVIGPHWTNFAWVGQDIFTKKIAYQGDNAEHVLNLIIDILDNPKRRTEVVKVAQAYIRHRKGGAKAVAKQVAEFLNMD